MRVFNTSLTVYSMGEFYSELLTEDLQDLVAESGVIEGSANVLTAHSTSAVLLMEHEAGILLDIEEVLESFCPQGNAFHHHTRKVDTNGRAHVFSALFNGSVTIPIRNGSMSLGEFQDVVFWDFQAIPKARTVMISVMGEEA
jgi:secondary thiamine-phosphate synthase enzyme